MKAWVNSYWIPFQRILIFWWILYFLFQQVQRFVLLSLAWEKEIPTLDIFLKTLLTGIRADLITATLAIGVAGILAGIVWTLLLSLYLIGVRKKSFVGFLPVLGWSSGLMGLLLLGILTVDLEYYAYNRQHLDFVFFEFLADLFAKSEAGPSQAALQTQGELQDNSERIPRLGAYFLMIFAVGILWKSWYQRRVGALLKAWSTAWPRVGPVIMIGLLFLASVGFHSDGWWSIQRVGISSSVYYSLAQNPVLYASSSLRRMFVSPSGDEAQDFLQGRSIEEVVEEARRLVVPVGTFPFRNLPFVRVTSETAGCPIESAGKPAGHFY